MNSGELSITLQELHSLQPDNFQIIDIRDEYAYEYGHIPGALNIPLKTIDSRVDEISRKKLLVLCCKSGQQSLPLAAGLRSLGLQAVSLEGGYYGWLRTRVQPQDKAKQVEQSIRKTYHRELWSRFAKAITTYQLIQPNDRIAVCMSGGKDSMLMAKLFQELQWHKKFPFELTFLVMDPGYSPENREMIEMNADMLGIPITVFESNIFDSVYHVKNNPCYLCARMRRGHLYKQAQDLGCNKIALGHHYDDVIETILMGMLYGGQVQTMMPKLHSDNFAGMELIRPMYLIREADILRWRDYNDLHFIQCACRFTDTCTTCSNENTGSKRMEVKNLIRTLSRKDPQVEVNIFRSVEHVNLKTIIGYKDRDGLHHFLDTYDSYAHPAASADTKDHADVSEPSADPQ